MKKCIFKFKGTINELLIELQNQIKMEVNK